ncbi:MAG: thiamine phosphate synthase [Chloroflexi bacterium]|nr:thiamine phosphate synthase [Chloroflexota bacterium]
MHRANAAPKIDGLYVIVGPDATRGRPVAEVAEAALRGGARVLQLRDKTGDRGDVLQTAVRLREMCRDHDALFFVNDDIALAYACDADGVHLGQSDLPVDVARRILAPDKQIGRSNNTDAEVEVSVSMGVDYVAVGAVFPTTTVGKGARQAIGLDGIRSARDTTDIPLVAIGGINESNVGDVIRSGADCVSVISAVTMADDPEDAARRLAAAIEDARS